ncbi:outer membrane beta-barrel protein [Marivirga salinae]|uniref:Outer membrane beta-barrel protein n=1 Tax=Marivirga salinarum TaxID=3059078 RepID=A0AA49GAL8_9BACT|nr:outer membrane beta-barrel protein [Marivirga sp. BDSF4-3]WKK76067.2 outer membrane beta-barrel protein [Marivirga sp. BDSF4-3]
MRKQLMLLTALLLISCPIFAQEEDSGESSSGGMAGAGDLLFEVTGTPFSGTSLLDFSEFRARYFITEDMAVRLGMEMNLNNNQQTPDVVTNDSFYGLMPGFEYHFVNDGPFRSYVAGDLMWGQRIASRKSSTGPTVLGANFDPDPAFGPNPTPTSIIQNRAYNQFGFRASIGAEYYFGKRFYVGGEVGFQYLNRSNKEVFVDGESFQDATKTSFGYLDTSNILKIGFRFLNF